ncbi:MAG: hypothetical protein ABIH40_04880 [Candidatus Omnitrophota bacterium]
MEQLQSLNPNRSKKALTVLKAVIVVFLLPWFYAFTAAFITELKTIPENLLNTFGAGLISFLVIYLFIYAPGRIYQHQQKVTEATFRFISPLVKLAPFVLPIYTIIVFLIYCLLAFLFKAQPPLELFMFLFGFSIIFHLVFTAKALRSRKDDFLMINYLFSFGIIYVINVALLSLGFSILFEPFSWLNFCKSSFQTSSVIFSSVFNQLFFK